MIAVTRLIDLLDKPGLKYWANKIGLKGINLRDYEPEVQSQGNIGHNEIENFIKNGVLFEGYEKFEKAISGFKVIGCEVDCNNGFICGRIDLILEREGKKIVVDIKRNKNIYLSTRLQLSTYKHLISADEIMYMNLDEMKLVSINIDTRKYYQIVQRLYQIHQLIENLNERL